ncbi:MAG TPA: hypothetical protein VEA40_18015, partial [Ramlibacter sp.]|nr:hypothetical protein [Ramlibacter sp.]
MASSGKDVTFTIPGAVEEEAPSRGANVKARVRIGTLRAAGPFRSVTARSGEDVVVLTLANGPRLVLHPENARDLLLAQWGPARSLRGGHDGVEVPAQLRWPGLEAASPGRGAARDWLGAATLAQFDILRAAREAAADLATAAATQALDGAVTEGVYALSPEPLPGSLRQSGARPIQVPPAADGGPTLVLVHGTFVDFASTFGPLWRLHPGVVRELFAAYRHRVYALDHPTLGRSPIGNALALVQALPAGARLHLLTHSRGGLVAEVLARACGGAGLSAAELALFPGEGYAVHRRELQQLFQLARQKALRVERVVRVACPGHGTLLASRRLDAYLSVLEWGLELAGVPVLPQLVDFLQEVARRR